MQLVALPAYLVARGKMQAPKPKRAGRNLPFKRWLRKKLQLQGAQRLRSDSHEQVCRNDGVAAQRRRWTFYEAITL
jgi:hypothetical protein